MSEAAGREGEAPHARRSGALRVLVAHNVPRAPTGGMSRIMTFIHDRLVEGGGFEVEYFCADDVAPRWQGAAARFAFPLLVLRRARLAARQGRPFDVVNVHEPSSAAVAALKGWAGAPRVVVTSHGVERRAWELALDEAHLGRAGPAARTRVIHPLTSLWQSGVGLRWADHVFCLNSEDEDFLRRRRMSVGGSGRVTRIYPAASEVFRGAGAGRDYARHPRQLLFAATWRKNKGVEDLVPAFAALAARHTQLELIVLGAGLRDEAVLGAFPADVRARVRCESAADDAETARRFAAADLFVLPSLFEGTPLTLMEAMAAGLPVVTTATCGMRDVVRDGETGLLVELRSPGHIVEAVERLLGDAGLRSRLGRAARDEAARKYTWERAAQPVREAYEELCARERPLPRPRRASLNGRKVVTRE